MAKDNHMPKRVENVHVLPFTGERYVPELRGTIALEHLHRYAFACQFVEDKVVLDIACGEGYGSEMLARTAQKVYGVDIDKVTVAHAKHKYKSQNLKFIEGSCEKIPLEDHCVDVIVSFETLEHTAKHSQMLLEFKRVLRLGGVVIISSPEKEAYADANRDPNPYHKKELSLLGFEQLLARHFKHCEFFGQRSRSGSEIYGLQKRHPNEAVFEFGKLPTDTLAETSDSRPLYLVAVCSDRNCPSLKDSYCIQKPWETDYARELGENLARCESALVQLESESKSIREEALVLRRSLADHEKISSQLHLRIIELNEGLRHKDQHVAELEHAVTRREQEASNLREFLGQRDAHITTLNESMAQRDGRIAGLSDTLGKRDAQITALNERLTHKEQHIAELECALAKRDTQITSLLTQAGSLANTVRELRASTSWKLTAPLRWFSSSGRQITRAAAHFPNRFMLRLSHSKIGNTQAVRGGLDLMSRLICQIKRLPNSVRILSAHRKSGLLDHAWYLQQNPDVRARTARPFLHFAFHGVFEGRPPHAGFDAACYAEHNPDIATASTSPLLHYVLWGYCENRPWRAAFSEMPPPEQTEGNVPISRRNTLTDGATHTDIRAIAIYLPQFHAIPENDEWWGKGFTEWTNVRRAVSQYEGHYQPHVPHDDLGYYDLNDPTVLEKQAAMARAASIEGFCFYYYWFNGKRLLEMPTDRLLATGRPDFPFCFCWANEDWTRTWDGTSNKILIGQEHTAGSDNRFIHDLLPALRDRRYIRVDGRPLLIVYRPGLLPKPLETTRRWRQVCREEGVGEIFLAYMRGFEWPEPASIGFDAAIQFPPLTADAPIINGTLEIKHPESFRGLVRDYNELARIFDPDQITEQLWPCVCPSWDNTARRMERAHSWAHATPEAYYRWLSKVVAKLRATQPPSRRLVFINAWNEWAEGCHLEPDEKFGYAWLNATRSAISGPARSPKEQSATPVGLCLNP